MQNKGFTLIELIVVVILISILAVSVIPKFENTSGYEVHTHRAQLMAALRLTQQRAMQQTDSTSVDYCHQIVFDVVNGITLYGIPDRLDCDNKIFPTPIQNWTPDATGHKVDGRYQITFDVNGLANQAVSFDWLGRPQGACSGGCVINITQALGETLKLTIEEEGYIHAFN